MITFVICYWLNGKPETGFYLIKLSSYLVVKFMDAFHHSLSTFVYLCEKIDLLMRLTPRTVYELVGLSLNGEGITQGKVFHLLSSCSPPQKYFLCSFTVACIPKT